MPTENKRILIIYPHFPPSNLAGVHRPRLFAQHLISFGWEPIVLTVHEDFYEEKPDWNLVKLLPKDLRIEKVSASKVGKFRIIGDIGLRAFFQLYKKAKKLIQTEKVDFIYIPIPSFYVALLGRKLHASTGVPYGIDYIDPWVHTFAGSEKIFSRHWFATKLSAFLEPIAVKNVSLITGVAEGYYSPVFDRNPRLQKKNVLHGAMPYGGEKKDHQIASQLHLKPYLFEKNDAKVQMVYAGAMLPKAYEPLESMLKSIVTNLELFSNVEFHFIGTGKSPDDKKGFNIKPLAEKYGLWEQVIFESPARIPYLDVLVHLEAASGILILGSTEPHYTPSKTYQGVLSGKPLMAILHKDSTAVDVIRKSNVGTVLDFNGESDIQIIEASFASIWNQYNTFRLNFKASEVDMKLFEAYSAQTVTGKLVSLLNKIVP